ncbi:MAG TPA: hypothetical protein VFU72_06240 [Nitrolancea sp.]|nr:hypothetical protein [Nitrolancea sp.]
MLKAVARLTGPLTCVPVAGEAEADEDVVGLAVAILLTGEAVAVATALGDAAPLVGLAAALVVGTALAAAAGEDTAAVVGLLEPPPQALRMSAPASESAATRAKTGFIQVPPEDYVIRESSLGAFRAAGCAVQILCPYDRRLG